MPGFDNRDYLNSKYPGAGGGGGDTQYLKLKEGDNRMRFVSPYADVGKHFGGAKPTTCIGFAQGCPVCAQAAGKEGDEKKAFSPTVRFMAWVMDFDDNRKIKLFEYGWSVQSALMGLAEDGEWPFKDGVPQFNVTVKKEKTGSRAQDVEYSVVPSPNGVGSALPEDILAELAKVTPVEQIAEKMVEKQMKDLGIDPAVARSAASAHPAAHVAVAKAAPAGEEEIRVEDIPF